MKYPTKLLEKKLLKMGYKRIVAIDEVGVGCLAGPVVVCAVTFDKKNLINKSPKLRGLKDSKLLSAKRRKIHSEYLIKSGLKYKVGLCYPNTIDRINIFRSTRLAMKRSVENLMRNLKPSNNKLKTIILVDGPHKIPGINYEQIPIVKGDRKVFSIACASIIAKVARDNMMTNYAKKYPNYGLEKNKGYGTKLHIARLISFGPSKIHRKSFAPVTNSL